jgi:hypothetical protein
MSRLAPLHLTTAALTLLMACQSDRATTPSPGQPSADLQDGANNGGNTDFFFLPPLVPDPSGTSSVYEPGDFNPNLRPSVEICALELNASGTPIGCVPGAPFKRFAPSELALSTTDEHYMVNWHTDDPPLGPGTLYRIRVLVGAAELGFVDVDPVGSGKELRNVQTEEYIRLVDGRTLPIKFRIENGSLCTNDDDCVEATARGGQDNTITTPSGRAGVFIPADALNEGEEITVIIQRHTDRPCLPADFPQRDECYDYFSDPPVRDRVRTAGSDIGVNQTEEGGFNIDVTVGMCVDVTGLSDEQVDSLQLHKIDPEADQPRVEALPNAFVDFLRCEESTVGGIRGVLRGLASLFVPRQLFAADAGLGGETGSFSIIGWGLPAEMTVASAPPAAAVTGTDVVPIVTVTDLTSARNPLAGIPVSFSIPGGRAIGVVLTDGKGHSGTVWTLGNATGPQTLQATARAVARSPITFALRAIELSGALSDPAGDVVPSTERLHPDLVSASVEAADGFLTLRVRFADGTFDPDVSAVTFSLDTDQDPATGHPGVNAAGTIDNELIGSEFIVRMGSACQPGDATLRKFTGTLNQFVEVARATVTVVTNGYDVSFPFARVEDDGRLNFKVTAAALISECGFTGILDIMSDEASPVGTTTEASDEPIG